MIDDKISLIANSFFPEYYQENGPNLVAFIKTYFEWLEQSNNVLYYMRSHVNNKDIDQTFDEFLIHFKNKFLPNIQLSTALSTKELVKQSVPFYRSRGTDLSFDLFFKAVYGEEVNIYRPYNDVFKLSSGLFKKDNYIELDPSFNNFSLIGQDIVGMKSNATAFIDSVIRKRSNTRLVDIAFISAINGTFQANEFISLDGVSSVSKINGSVNELLPYSSDSGFLVGEEVSFESDSGIDGLGYVSNVTTIDGLVNFSLLDGGWGYTTNVNVYISNVVATFSNVSRPLTYETIPVSYFSNVTQSIQNITYTGANGTFTVGDVISVYSSNVSTGSATVLSISNVTSNSGFLVVSQFSGNLQSNTIFYNESNAVTATANVFSDVSVHAENINLPNTIQITTPYSNPGFSVGESVYQTDSLSRPVSSGIISNYFTVGTNTVYTVTNCSTLFYSNTNVYSFSSNISANVLSLSFTLGLYGNSSFITLSNNFCSGNNLFDGGTLSYLYGGTGATFIVPTNRTNVETANIATSNLNSVANVALNANSYGSSLNNANLTNLTLSQALVYQSVNVGSIQLISGFNPGQNYTTAPYILIVDPFISLFQKQDFNLQISNPSGIFNTGEIIIQNTTNMKGLVKFANSSFVYAERLSFEDNWSNSYSIVGQSTFYTANVVSYSSNVSSIPAGENANVQANSVSVNGAITSIVVETSGIGFNRSIQFGELTEDLVTFYSQDRTRSGQALATLGGQGKSKGYYESYDGFLSSTKKLTDSYYYQPFAYEIQTPLSPNVYKSALKNILHTAGKIYFSSLNKIDAISGVVSSESTITLSYVPSLDFSQSNNSGYLGFF